MRTMNVPFSNITDLKKSPAKLFARAAAKQTGVYIFNRDQPAGVVLDVADYEALVNQNEALQDRVFELEQDYLVAQRLQHQEREQASLVDDRTVRGSAADEAPHLDENDGWA
ncbi:type II toxin-antitoxin system Phd/YefM family antitoxin [Levilactobacillus yiduensis]|uniref:type II toxin-antitoxin system Phd/YefM family antitoxin n=1 Tax=Levilactobacillus yiduensis TaxID=2953880 RepID=UPI000EF29E1C|nr:type II toxin-antitoxin system Phd/YefM family antitoxin [Levilactobacillus yiduensis]AYM02030.1 type II toxin-antitoxin system Phd/YefM family antitoxin [Levilactobacillus brevis]